MLFPRRFASQTVALVLLVAVAFPARPAFAQIPAEASRVRILLIADTDAAGASVNAFQRDQVAVKKVLSETLRDLKLEQRYTLDILQGADATPAKILAYYRELKTEPSEALICYYSGHGGADAVDGHYLDLEGGKLRRAALRAAMEAK